jgi:hypothetical protein
VSYWRECLTESFEINGIKATPEQIKAVADDVRISHQNYSMYDGSDCIPHPAYIENERLKTELKAEKEKVVCALCHGKGRLISYGGTYQSDSQCYGCNGEGYRKP